MDAPFPTFAHVGSCIHCGGLKLISGVGLCQECAFHLHHLQERQRKQEKLLEFGLTKRTNETPSAPAGPTEAPTNSKTVPSLFILCVAYLSNNADMIEREAILYLPSEVRYFIFLLVLSNSHAQRWATSLHPAGPRLRLAKRFLSPATTPNESMPTSPSFKVFDFSLLRSHTSLTVAQLENVFDHLTSFGRPSVEHLRVLSLKGLPFVTDAALRTVAAQLRRLRVLDISFCDAVTDAGLVGLLPHFIRSAPARDSWEDLAAVSDEDDGHQQPDDVDVDVNVDVHDEALVSGLLHLQRLGIYACGQLTQASLKALRLAYAGRTAAPTVYTSMLLVRGVDDEGVVTFVNDVLQWSAREEDALFALHGWQIEEVDALRMRYYDRQEAELCMSTASTMTARRRKGLASLVLPPRKVLQELNSGPSLRKGRARNRASFWSHDNDDSY